VISARGSCERGRRSGRIARRPSSPDGGYWTLGAPRLHPALFEAIDWGTPAVFEQTLTRAAAAGLAVRRLPVWYDVDQPEDLEALRLRLTDATPGRAEPPAADPLERLAAELAALGLQATKDPPR
jgi:hypothetical protein